VVLVTHFAETPKFMLAPIARRLERLAEEARVIAERSMDPWAKRTMERLALSYEQLAKHARAREAQSRDCLLTP
jgi:hypothetical protein